jgi:hypothetical protein
MEWNHECVSKSERKFWPLESDFLKAWTILHKLLKQGCCSHLFLSHRLIQNKQRNNCEAIEMMARKIHVCIKNWEFHLVTPLKCQKCHPPSLKPPMWSSGQLQVHYQPLCADIIGVRIRLLSWLGVSTLSKLNCLMQQLTWRAQATWVSHFLKLWCQST